MYKTIIDRLQLRHNEGNEKGDFPNPEEDHATIAKEIKK